MYSMPPGQPLWSFKHNISCNISLTITSALNRCVVIVGSNDGYARVYDPKMAIMTGILQHGNCMMFIFWWSCFWADFFITWKSGSSCGCKSSFRKYCLVIDHEQGPFHRQILHPGNRFLRCQRHQNRGMGNESGELCLAIWSSLFMMNSGGSWGATSVFESS